jgi:hypothetical protein
MIKVAVTIVSLFMGILMATQALSAGFTGMVTNVNVNVQTITVKESGKTVTFDVSNPVLKGYRSVTAIGIGDRIEIAYSRQGVTITRISGKPSRVYTETPRSKPEVRKSKKEGRTRVVFRTRGTDFSDVDENQDGRITAVELSVIIPDLTRDLFKSYDINSDGYLNRSEFKAVRKP